MLLLRHLLLMNPTRADEQFGSMVVSGSSDNKRKRDISNETIALNNEKKKLLHSVHERLDDLNNSKLKFNTSFEIVKERPLTQTEDSYYTPRRLKINMNEFKFIISGKRICKESFPPFLLILILSSHSHMDTREAIRKTWGSIASTAAWPLIGGVKESVKLVFLFGRGRSALGDSLVKEESKLYGDVVQADFVDSYFNLTRKILTGLRWASIFCPGAKFILKADEDVFVSIPNLIEVLKERPLPLGGMIYGYVHDNATVLRKGRWAVTMTDFPFKIYPPYTCGNTYVLSGNIIKVIYNISQYLPFLNIEDVFVTGITRKSLGIPISHINGFTHWHDKKPKPCQFKNFKRISATKVDDALQYAIWDGQKDKSLQDCYVPKKRKVITRPEKHYQYINNNFRDDHIYYNNNSGNFYVIK